MSSRLLTLTLALAASLALALPIACGGGTAPARPDGGSACGPCPAGQGCDLAARSCVVGANEGARCAGDAPPGAPLICVDGLVCSGVPDGKHICARPCAGKADCHSGELCVLAQVDGGTNAYCATPVPPGGDCDPERLTQCVSSGGGMLVQCIERGVDGGGGQCLQRCDARATCPSGQACSTPFSDGAGVCGAIKHPGDRCNQAQLDFCNAGQHCVLESGNFGICHTACDASATPCAANEFCVHADPCASGSPAFCVVPQPNGSACDLAADHFCGADSDCVSVNNQLICQPDCSRGQACASGSCHALSPTCLSACF